MFIKDIDSRLEQIHTGLVNLRDDPELNGPMGAAGYTTERIHALLDLYDAAFAAVEKQRAEYGEQYGATQDFYAAWETARKTYMRHVQLARVVYKNDVGKLVKLGLSGRRKKTFSGWTAQAHQFYDGALNDAEIQGELAGVGISVQDLQDGLSLVNAADQAAHTQQEEIGEAQKATQDRDALLEQIFDAWSDLVAIARVIFDEDPQQLEKMGILARSE